jgi:hypothetical protein
LSSSYSIIERFRNVEEEAREILKTIESRAVEALHTGNPIPVWVWIVLAGGLAGLFGVGLWQFFRATEPIVKSIEQWAPIMGGAFSVLMYVLAFMPFFFIFNIVVSMLR